MRTPLALLLTITGCGGGGNNGDMGHDMAMRDLSKPPDLAGVPTFRYVTNTILLPKTKADYAVDLNGDGKMDNGLGDIAHTLGTLQPPIDLALQETNAVSSGD